MIKLAKRFLKPYRFFIVSAPLLKFVEALFELFLPLLMAELIDKGIATGDKTFIINQAIKMAILSIVGFICCMYCQISASYVGMGFGRDLRKSLFSKIFSLSNSELDGLGTAQLVNNMTIDAHASQNAVAMFIRLVLRAPFLCVGGVIMAIYTDIRLSAILLIFIPIFAFMLIFIVRKNTLNYKQTQAKLDVITDLVKENVAGVRVLRAFSAKEGQRHKFNEANTDWARSELRASRLSSLLSPLTTLIMNMAIIAILWFGNIRVNSVDGLSAGKLIAFISYVTQIMLAFVVVTNLSIIFMRAQASANRINAVFETAQTVSSGKQTEFDLDKTLLRLDNVSFSFDGQHNALSNISFSLESGEMMGIIGGTGAGKSSLVSLILRFYNATEGNIYVHGRDIKEYDLDFLRERIGLVPQKAVLMSGSLRHNLTLGKPDATDEEIAEALEIAQIAKYVDTLPKKYDYMVYEGGKNFSGGQKQRFTIARAVIKKPKLLIFDDSASALDGYTDANVRKAVAERLTDTSAIIISQRVSAVRHLKTILVMDNGRIVGSGSHSELLKSCEIYREIYQSQMEVEHEK